MDEIQQLLERLRGSLDPTAATRVDRTYELRFVGDTRRFTFVLGESGVRITAGAAPDGACGLGWHVEDLEDLLQGRVTLATLFSSRRLRVFGNVGDAMRLEQVLPPLGVSE